MIEETVEKLLKEALHQVKNESQKEIIEDFIEQFKMKKSEITDKTDAQNFVKDFFLGLKKRWEHET